MKKIDEVVLRETKYIAIWTMLFSLLMQSVFLVIGKWDYTVLLGNILSEAAVILNYFLIGITVQRALEKDEKDAKSTMKLSQLYRFLLLFAVIILGVLLPCFNTWAVIIPVFFPRFAIALRSLLDKKNS